MKDPLLELEVRQRERELHEDAQTAALVWNLLWGAPVANPLGHVLNLESRAMTRSLALIARETPFRDAIDTTDIWELLTAYDQDLLNWDDVYEALRSTLA